ncbi:hypothetical protein QQ045_021022 [Rhodiola kirilowii]
MNLCFFLLALLFTSTAAYAAAAAAGDDHLQLLINFKSKLLPNHYDALPDWLPSNNLCNFHGVTCKNGLTVVSAIHLTDAHLFVDFRLVYTLLMNINTLEVLSLRNVTVSGSLLASSAYSSSCSPVLYSLDLGNNAITGTLSHVSHLISSCSALKSLNLTSNLLQVSPSSTSSFHLGALQTLDLSRNRLTGEDALPYIFSSAGCSSSILEWFSVKGNRLTGSLTPLTTCDRLEFLDISQNDFSATLPPFINCSSLRYLDFSRNKLSGSIGDSLVRCGHLQFLNASSNHFTGEIPSFGTDDLNFVYLSDNKFSGGIPANLVASCKSLQILDLSGNALSGAVPFGLSNCSSLTEIDISNNNFSGEFPVQLFLEMINLKKLVCSYNNFVGSLPHSLDGLRSLEWLDLSSNNISGAIPSALCNMKQGLKVLYLQNNWFTGGIPESLGNCSELESIDLSFNYLTGMIPRSLGMLYNLQDLIIWFNNLHGEIPQELENLSQLENLILDFNHLAGNIPSGLRNCTNLNWISLSNNQFTGEIPAWIGELSNLSVLKLSNNSFTGPIPPELGDCKSLIWLDLNTNFFIGSIPPSLFKQSGNIAVGLITGKRYAYIKTDGSKECHGAGNLLEFAGIRQEQLTRLSTRNPCNFTTTRVYGGLTRPTFNHNGSMIFLDISHNLLSGSIPKEIGVMFYLYVLNLGSNDLSGTIPQELGSLNNLNILDLSGNRLEGVIPQSLTGLTMLMEVDLSNNNFSGQIPESGQFEILPPRGFLNNSGLCGIPLEACSGKSDAGLYSHHKSQRREASLIGSVAMGLLFSVFCIFSLILVAAEAKRRREKKDSALDIYVENNSSRSATINTSWKITGIREAFSINLSTYDKPLKKLTFADLLEATNGFHNDNIIGSGGFGDVYKAHLKDGSIVAIKKLIHISGQGDREFTAEMETIGKIKHRNLVKLLGFCKVGEERLLVYEYIKFGSLDDVLHNKKKAGIKLDWLARRKIAIGAARGLAFLHHNCTPHIIHRDMKSSNVLVDENLEARVADFGMARLVSTMDTHLSVSTLAGTPGYVPPEYYQSFRCSTKGDVYSYGVVLLELLTGRQPTESADFGDSNLVGWVKQHAKLKIRDVFDPMLLKEDPDLEIELLQHLKVACACLDDRPRRRPTMIQVMTMFKEIQAGPGFDSTASTISVDEGTFETEMVEMTIHETPEPGRKQ